MSRFSKPVRVALGATIGFGLLLGTACGGSGGGGDTPTRAAAAAPVEEAAAAPDTTQPPATAAPSTAAPTTTAKPAAARANTPATPAQPASTAATTPTPAPTAAQVQTPAPTNPPTTLPARPNVTSAQVQAAINQFRTRILLFSPTEAQARQFGDMVCDAFDAGQNYAQVKATALAQVAQYPLVTVTSADADFILGIAVRLFCPAYATKLP